jgi:pimeloyl-ACP methyl ester carboxylesterase
MLKSAFKVIFVFAFAACSTTPKPAPAELRMQVEGAINAYGRDQFSDLAYKGILNGNALELTGKLNSVPFFLRVPKNWNKKGIIWAHGYESPTNRAPTRVSEIAEYPISDGFLGQGFAYTGSAYAKTGYAVESAIKESIKLRELLGKLGVETSYVFGLSMGGNVGMGLIEKYPKAFDGALLMCGVVSGWERQIEHMIDFRLVYDYFTTNLDRSTQLPGRDDPLKVDAANISSTIQNAVTQLFARASSGENAAIAASAQIAAVTGVPDDPISFFTTLNVFAVGLNDYLATAGGNGYSNVGKNYRGSQDDAALNEKILRIDSSPTATAYLKANYTPTGRWNAKLLSVHNTFESLVPFKVQAQLKAVATASSNTSHLVQQIVDGRAFNPNNETPKHCDFNFEQIAFAWNELRAWVEQGQKPEDGKNITGAK